jgi:AcrR family transcriptional regulator
MSTTTRQLILQRCFEAIQAKGFETLRTDKEIARLKITKGAFYHYFPNKSELGYAVVDEVMLPYYEQKWASLNNIETGVAAALNSIFENEKAKANETTIKRGDVLTNMILELSHSDDLFRQKLEAVNEVQVRILQKAIMAGRVAGELKNQTDARSMALFIIGQMMGCYTIGKVRASKDTFISMVSTLQKQVKESLVMDSIEADNKASSVAAAASAPASYPTMGSVSTIKNTEAEKTSRGGWFNRSR